jgi:peptidoglycan/LPS O-acetylase OafA/YrhL
MVLIAHFHREELVLSGSTIIGSVTTKVALMGLYGVDLFFVLSGFLITRILLNSRARPDYFGRFYKRRFLRIFPLYYGALIVIFIVAPLLVAFDEPAKRIQENQWALWTYLSNVPLRPWGWDNSQVFMVGHFWSLAVEEQFYLVWPLVLWRIKDCSSLKKVCLATMVAGFTARVLPAFYDGAGFLTEWSTITRIDGLAAGSMVAILVFEKREQTVRRLAAKCLIPLCCAFVIFGFLPRRWDSPVIYATYILCVALFSGALLVHCQNPASGRLSNLMQHRVLRFFGKYSYGLYVIHGIIRPGLARLIDEVIPVHAIPFPIVANLIVITLSIAVSLILAMVSWKILEQPFLKLKRYT